MELAGWHLLNLQMVILLCYLYCIFLEAAGTQAMTHNYATSAV